MKELFNNWKTVPNFLCLTRILLVPVFAVFYLKGYPEISVLVLIVSGLTDTFDGRIARKFNQTSELGKILDPVADKLTQIAVALVLLIRFYSSSSASMRAFSWVFLLFLLKEAVMMLVGLYLLTKGIKPSVAAIYGKVATFVFYVVMLLLIAFGPEIGAFSTYDLRMAMPEWLAFTLVIMSLVLTFVAFASYIPGTVKQIKDSKNTLGDN